MNSLLNPGPNIATRIIAVVMILPCLYVAWMALTWGIADRHANPAEQRLDDWAAGEPIIYEELSWAIAKTETAIEWAPNNPNYRDQLARLLLIRLIREQDLVSGESAKVHLLHSRQIRPEWPRNWALYINVKHNMAEADDALSEAIVTATGYGRWDPSLHRSVTEAGVAHYDKLTDDAKKAVIGNVQRSFNSPVPGIARQTIRLIVNQANGTSPEFINEMLNYLVIEPWSDRAQPHLIELTLLWWPYLNPEERLKTGVQIAGIMAVSKRNSLIRTVQKTGRLPEICPMLPRQARFKRACDRAYRITK